MHPAGIAAGIPAGSAPSGRTPTFIAPSSEPPFAHRNAPVHSATPPAATLPARRLPIGTPHFTTQRPHRRYPSGPPFAHRNAALHYATPPPPLPFRPPFAHRPPLLAGSETHCGVYCGREYSMETIQVVLDTELLKATDMAAKRYAVNRSALIRQALGRHLKYLHELELEDRDRRGYLAHPQREEEFRVWEDTASWPRP